MHRTPPMLRTAGLVIALITAPGFFANTGARPLNPTQQSVVDKHRAAIETSLAQKPGWQKGSYELTWMDGWADTRLPIIVALPKKPIAWSPRFAVLPDGKLVSAFDAAAFSQIVKAVFAKPAEKDADEIAQVATLFAHFGKPVGKLLAQWPAGMGGEGKPRKNAGPVFRQEGGAATIQFYGYNYELDELYDCTVRIVSGDVTLDAKQVSGS